MPELQWLVTAFPKTERARGYLEGIAHAAGLPLGDDTVDAPDPLDPTQLEPGQHEAGHHGAAQGDLDQPDPDRRPPDRERSVRRRKRRRSAPDQDQLPFDSSQSQ